MRLFCLFILIILGLCHDEEKIHSRNICSSRDGVIF